MTAFFSALSSCSKSDTAASLLTAEKIMEERPDSALSILQSIDASRFATDNDKALYALLLTQASVKNNLYVSSDSMISMAAEHYASTHDRTRLMKARFYQAYVLDELKHPVNAVIPALEAYQEADSMADHYWVAKTAELLSHILISTFNMKDAATFNEIAIQSYTEADKMLNRQYAICDRAIIVSNSGLYRKGIAILDSLSNSLGDSHADRVCRAYCYKYKIPMYVKAQMFQEALATINSLREMTDCYNLDQSDLSYEYFIHSILGNGSSSYGKTPAHESLPSSEFLKMSDNLSFAYLTNSLYYRNVGMYDKAFAAMDSIIAIQNRELINAWNEPVSSILNSFKDNEIRESNKKNHLLWLIIAFSVCLLILVSVCFFIYLSMRRKSHALTVAELIAENSRLANKIGSYGKNIESLSESLESSERRHLETANKLEDRERESAELREKLAAVKDDSLSGNLNQKDSLVALHLKSFNDLFTNFPDDFESEKAKLKAADIIYKRLQNYLSSERIKAIEKAVNGSSNGIVSRLSQQCPSLNNEERLFMTLIYADFSLKAISVMLGIKGKYIYVKKQRIIGKIAASDAPDKEEFMNI